MTEPVELVAVFLVCKVVCKVAHFQPKEMNFLIHATQKFVISPTRILQVYLLFVKMLYLPIVGIIIATM